MLVFDYLYNNFEEVRRSPWAYSVFELMLQSLFVKMKDMLCLQK